MPEGTTEPVNETAEARADEKATTRVAPGEAEPHFTHPGLKWIDDAACKDLELPMYFVEAGHVMPEEARKSCMECPVWEKCLIYSYLANPDGKMISGGYFAGFSLGQRRKLTLGQAIEQGRKVREEYRQERAGALL